MNHWNIGSLRNLRHPKDVLRLFFHPLVATDSSDAENIKPVRLQENENGLLIAGTGPAGVLVNDDFDFLGGGVSGEENTGEKDQSECGTATVHCFPIPSKLCRLQS